MSIDDDFFDMRASVERGTIGEEEAFDRIEKAFYDLEEENDYLKEWLKDCFRSIKVLACMVENVTHKEDNTTHKVDIHTP